MWVSTIGQLEDWPAISWADSSGTAAIKLPCWQEVSVIAGMKSAKWDFAN
jgi:hypothetical protein